MRQPFQPANGASSATDAVQRTQILDTSGTVITSFGGASTTGTPADAFAAPGAIPEQMSFPMGWNGTTWDRLKAGAAADGVANLTGVLGVMPVMNAGNTSRSLISVQSGDTGGLSNVLLVGPGLVSGSASVSAQRTPAIFKSINAVAITAGTGATVWTPAAGKKFRLMGFSLSVTVAAGLIFGDNAVATVIYRGPLLAAAGFQTIGAADTGNGFLSAAANNVLKLDVTATATVTGFVFGTEE